MHVDLGRLEVRVAEPLLDLTGIGGSDRVVAVLFHGDGDTGGGLVNCLGVQRDDRQEKERRGEPSPSPS